MPEKYIRKYNLKCEEKNRIVVMSDLHLGEEECVLNNWHFPKPDFDYVLQFYKKNKPADVDALIALREDNVKTLRAELHRLGPIDELILLGDFLDFSLATLQQAYGNAQKFFRILLGQGNSPSPSIKEITYIPGNHDHHLWLKVFEHYDVTNYIRDSNLPDGNQYPRWLVDQDDSSVTHNWDVTLEEGSLLREGVIAARPNPSLLRRGTFLQDLLPRDKKIPVHVRYPHVLREVEGRLYYFTHGHYLQKAFRPVTEVVKPHSFGELEAFNCGWLEAIWYHLGQAGRLSFLEERIYEFRTDEYFRKTLRVVLEDLLSRFAPLAYYPIKLIFFIGDTLRHLGDVVRRLKKKDDRRFRKTLYSPLRGRDIEKLKKLVEDYVEKDLFQFITFINHQGGVIDQTTPFTFVFGHTHKTTGLKSGQTKGIETDRINGIRYPLENTGAWLEEGKEGGNTGFFVIEKGRLRWVHVPVA